jgi:hypothetical protein
MLARMSHHLDDDARLQRLLPHVLSVAADPATVVRVACVTAVRAVRNPELTIGHPPPATRSAEPACSLS